MKQYLALLLFCMATVVVAQEEKVEEKEMKIPLTIKVEPAPWDKSKGRIVVKTKDLVFVPDDSKIISRKAELVVEDDQGNFYEMKNGVFYSDRSPKKAKKGEKVGKKSKLEWGKILREDMDVFRGKQLHITGSVYYEMPVKMVKIDPPQPLVMKKGEKLAWENLVLEVCSEPAVATSIDWDWKKETYIAKQEEGEILSFFVPLKIESSEELELWDEKFFDLSSKEFSSNGRGSSSFTMDGKTIRGCYYQFPAKHKCEELLISLNYTKGRIRYRIPVDQKVTVPEKKQDQKKTKEEP